MRRVLGWPQILQRVTGSSLKFVFFQLPGLQGTWVTFMLGIRIAQYLLGVWILMKIYPSSLEGSLKAPSQVSSMLLGTVLVTRERLYPPFGCSTLQEVDQLTCSNHQDITPEVEFLAGSSRTLVMRKPRSTGGSSAGGSYSGLRSLGGMLGWDGAQEAGAHSQGSSERGALATSGYMGGSRILGVPFWGSL